MELSGELVLVALLLPQWEPLSHWLRSGGQLLSDMGGGIGIVDKEVVGVSDVEMTRKVIRSETNSAISFIHSSKFTFLPAISKAFMSRDAMAQAGSLNSTKQKPLLRPTRE